MGLSSLTSYLHTTRRTRKSIIQCGWKSLCPLKCACLRLDTRRLNNVEELREGEQPLPTLLSQAQREQLTRFPFRNQQVDHAWINGPSVWIELAGRGSDIGPPAASTSTPCAR